MIPSPDESSDLPQEEDHVSHRDVILGMLVVFAITAAMIIWAWATTDMGLAARRPARELPEEQLGPRRDVEGVRQAIFRHGGVGEVREGHPERALEVYRWLDPDRQIVTLPIDKAMDRIAEESER
jgi:hypothetical protein